MSNATAANEYDRADFKGLYKGGTLVESAKIRSVPWEIGRAQPAVCAILHQGRRGRLLDVGCGLGRNAAAARDLDYDVTAIDISEDAVEKARSRFEGIDFRVADACGSKLDPGFSLILDSATYHAIPSPLRAAYLTEMRRLAATDAVMHIVTFAPSPKGMPRPLAVDLSEIARNAEGTGWDIVSATREEYKGNAEAIADFSSKKCLSIETDHHGFTRLPCWHVALDATPPGGETC